MRALRRPQHVWWRIRDNPGIPRGYVRVGERRRHSWGDSYGVERGGDRRTRYYYGALQARESGIGRGRKPDPHLRPAAPGAGGIARGGFHSDDAGEAAGADEQGLVVTDREPRLRTGCFQPLLRRYTS